MRTLGGLTPTFLGEKSCEISNRFVRLNSEMNVPWFQDQRKSRNDCSPEELFGVSPNGMALGLGPRTKGGSTPLTPTFVLFGDIA